MAPRLGVLLVNLGGPERLEDVKPFLYNLFSDPAILPVRSARVRKLLAWLIATARASRSRDYYSKIGGGSPLRRITEEQAAALGERLAGDGVAARVYVGMQCWRPTLEQALDRVRADGVTHLVVLPLYPQFSGTTTGSAIDRLRRLVRRRGLDAGLAIAEIGAWWSEPGYVAAIADEIRSELSSFPDPEPEKSHLLYSAHSIPQRFVDGGDPYLEQTRRTVELLNRSLAERHPWTLAFQSRVGPVRWLGPAAPDVIRSLADRGVEQLLVIPVSFVSDHVETLYEIDVLYRDVALAAGIRHFRRVPALNCHSRFIAALAELVKAQMGALGLG